MVAQFLRNIFLILTVVFAPNHFSLSAASNCPEDVTVLAMDKLTPDARKLVGKLKGNNKGNLWLTMDFKDFSDLARLETATQITKLGLEIIARPEEPSFRYYTVEVRGRKSQLTAAMSLKQVALGSTKPPTPEELGDLGMKTEWLDLRALTEDRVALDRAASSLHFTPNERVYVVVSYDARVRHGFTPTFKYGELLQNRLRVSLQSVAHFGDGVFRAVIFEVNSNANQFDLIANSFSHAGVKTARVGAVPKIKPKDGIIRVDGAPGITEFSDADNVTIKATMMLGDRTKRDEIVGSIKALGGEVTRAGASTIDFTARPEVLAVASWLDRVQNIVYSSGSVIAGDAAAKLEKAKKQVAVAMLGKPAGVHVVGTTGGRVTVYVRTMEDRAAVEEKVQKICEKHKVGYDFIIGSTRPQLTTTPASHRGDPDDFAQLRTDVIAFFDGLASKGDYYGDGEYMERDELSSEAMKASYDEWAQELQIDPSKGDDGRNGYFYHVMNFIVPATTGDRHDVYKIKYVCDEGTQIRVYSKTGRLIASGATTDDSNRKIRWD